MLLHFTCHIPSHVALIIISSVAEVQGREAADKSPFELERIFWKNMGRFPATYGADNPGMRGFDQGVE